MKLGACGGGWVTRRLPTCCSAWLPREPGSSSRYVPWGLMLGGSANPAGEETPQPRAGRREHSPRAAQHRRPQRGRVQSASPPPQLRVEEREATSVHLSGFFRLQRSKQCQISLASSFYHSRPQTSPTKTQHPILPTFTAAV